MLIIYIHIFLLLLLLSLFLHSLLLSDFPLLLRRYYLQTKIPLIYWSRVNTFRIVLHFRNNLSSSTNSKIIYLKSYLCIRYFNEYDFFLIESTTNFYARILGRISVRVQQIDHSSTKFWHFHFFVKKKKNYL